VSERPVIDNAAASRFEMVADNQLCVIDYLRNDNELSLIHAEVPAALNGRGFGSQLVKGALDIIRQRKETMIPSCSFVAAYVRRHAEYLPLISRRP